MDGGAGRGHGEIGAARREHRARAGNGTWFPGQEPGGWWGWRPPLDTEGQAVRGTGLCFANHGETCLAVSDTPAFYTFEFPLLVRHATPHQANTPRQVPAPRKMRQTPHSQCAWPSKWPFPGGFQE